MQVSYNFVVMDLVHTQLCERRPILSADGTELLYMQTTYALTMMFNPKSMAYFPGSPPAPTVNASAATTDTAIRYALMEPRKQFLMRADEPGGLVVYRVPAAGFDRDPANGPFPQSCTVKQVTPKSWRVEWRVQVATIECGPDDMKIPPLLSNRWSQSQSTGPNRLTTVITKGVATFDAAKLAALGKLADYYRSDVIPGLALNFKRRSADVNVSTAGTSLVWQTVDDEQVVSIGGTDDPRRMGVVDFKAVVSSSSATADGANMPSNWLMLQFDGYASGDATSSRAGMLAWLSKLAVERLAIPAGPVDPQTQSLILKVTTSEHVESAEVELHITAQVPPAKVGKVGLGELRTDFIGIDVINMFANDGKNPQMPNDSNTRGTADTQILVAALKDACSRPAPLPYAAGDQGPGSPDDNYFDSSFPVTVSVSDEIPSTLLRFSEDATSSGTYTEMSIETRYRTNRGKLAVPIAGPVADPNVPSWIIGGGPGVDVGTGDGAVLPGGGTPVDATGGDDTAILTIARPMTTVEIRFEAERTSAPPLIPHPEVNDPNLVLMEDEVSPMAVGVAADGQTPVFRVGGRYLYAAKNARKAAAGVAFGVHPFTDFSYDDPAAQFDPANFVHGIIDSENGSSGTPGGGSPGDQPPAF